LTKVLIYYIIFVRSVGLFFVSISKGGRFMAKKRNDFCPACGKVEISRIVHFGVSLDVGGWNIVCSYCGEVVWVPSDPARPLVWPRMVHEQAKKKDAILGFHKEEGKDEIFVL